MNIIIFSKDRAAQLDLLLRSLKYNFKEFDSCKIHVLYDSSEEDFYKGYLLLSEDKNLCVNVEFVSDKLYGTFRESLLKILNLKNELSMFLVDDIIFKSSFSLSDKEIEFVKNNEQIIAHSLRLWNGINHCYATNKPNSIPAFVKRYIWNWTSAEGDWGYPMSVDGNIYRTKFIFDKIKEINFRNPNQLEANLAATADRTKQYMSCYVEESKLLNVPANIVQTTFSNRHGNIIDVKELNNNFLSGKKLSFEHILNCSNNTVHVELPFKWIGE